MSKNEFNVVVSASFPLPLDVVVNKLTQELGDITQVKTGQSQNMRSLFFQTAQDQTRVEKTIDDMKNSIRTSLPKTAKAHFGFSSKPAHFDLGIETKSYSLFPQILEKLEEKGYVIQRYSFHEWSVGGFITSTYSVLKDGKMPEYSQFKADIDEAIAQVLKENEIAQEKSLEVNVFSLSQG